MRTLLALILIAAVSAEQFHFRQEVNFWDEITVCLKGFFKGIGKVEAITDATQCVKNADNMVKEVETAVTLILKGSITEAIVIIMKLYSQLQQNLVPCYNTLIVFEDLLEAIFTKDIQEVINKIMNNIGTLYIIGDKLLSCFIQNQYECIGEQIGTFIKVIFLSTELDASSNALEFIKALLIAIGETGDINVIERCVKDIDESIKEIIEAFELIRKGGMHIPEGVIKLIAAVRKLLDGLKPCSDSLKVLKELIHNIGNIDIKKIIVKVTTHIKTVGSIIKDFIACYKSKDYKCMGNSLGKLLKLLFL